MFCHLPGYPRIYSGIHKLRLPLRRRTGRPLWSVAILLLLAASGTAAAFDREGYKVRAEATLAELNAKRISDIKGTLARLDEMMTIGIGAIQEYAGKEPKYAKLMNAAIADVPSMKGMTDVQLEEKWGEKGTGGDAVGIRLQNLDEAGIERAYLELVVGPAHQYVFIKRWQTTNKSRLLEQARDEAVELLKHFEAIPAS
jgi:hypothetical protein